MPVSATDDVQERRVAGALDAIDGDDHPPRAVNLSALPTRLIRTCCSRSQSAVTWSGTSGVTSQRSVEPFFPARGRRASSCSGRAARAARRAGSRLMRPASIFETSRMSLMTRSSDSADVAHERAATRAARRVRSVSSSSPVTPMMPFIGVRISWLMFARNSLLVRFDSSACCRASSSSRDCVWSLATSVAGEPDRRDHPRAQPLGGARRQRHVQVGAVQDQQLEHFGRPRDRRAARPRRGRGSAARSWPTATWLKPSARLNVVLV